MEEINFVDRCALYTKQDKIRRVCNLLIDSKCYGRKTSGWVAGAQILMSPSNSDVKYHVINSDCSFFFFVSEQTCKFNWGSNNYFPHCMLRIIQSLFLDFGGKKISEGISQNGGIL